MPGISVHLQRVCGRLICGMGALRPAPCAGRGCPQRLWAALPRPAADPHPSQDRAEVLRVERAGGALDRAAPPSSMLTGQLQVGSWWPWPWRTRGSNGIHCFCSRGQGPGKGRTAWNSKQNVREQCSAGDRPLLVIHLHGASSSVRGLRGGTAQAAGWCGEVEMF